MFFMHAKFSLELIALVSGVALIIFIKNQNKVKKLWPIFVAWIVIILSVLSILCSAYYTIKYWNYRHFNMHYRLMMQQKMMENKKNNKYMYKDIKKNKNYNKQMKNK